MVNFEKERLFSAHRITLEHKTHSRECSDDNVSSVENSNVIKYSKPY